jgi:hypothetical protein
MENVKLKRADHVADNGTASAEIVPLHLRYRKIGISAVAAAARYQGSAKNHEYAPATNGTDPDPAAA